jgi:hypothetical protein
MRIQQMGPLHFRHWREVNRNWLANSTSDGLRLKQTVAQAANRWHQQSRHGFISGDGRKGSVSPNGLHVKLLAYATHAVKQRARLQAGTSGSNSNTSGLYSVGHQFEPPLRLLSCQTFSSIVSGPWYIRNDNLHKDLDMETVDSVTESMLKVTNNDYIGKST